ncbi:MAG: hypothetical protein F4Z13_01135 [Candidatus Dadabacteria bacterium]|nr:hypothetical protein [Candidatus Dadabacteria bacterium]
MKKRKKPLNPKSREGLYYRKKTGFQQKIFGAIYDASQAIMLCGKMVAFSVFSKDFLGLGSLVKKDLTILAHRLEIGFVNQ